MIYRVAINGPQGRELCIYAHPQWPSPITNDGDPTDEFKVLFTIREGVCVYKRSSTSVSPPAFGEPPLKLEETYYLLRTTDYEPQEGTERCTIANIKGIENLSELG